MGTLREASGRSRAAVACVRVRSLLARRRGGSFLLHGNGCGIGAPGRERVSVDQRHRARGGTPRVERLVQDRRGALAVPSAFAKNHYASSDVTTGVGDGAMQLTIEPTTRRVTGTLDGAIGAAVIEGLLGDGQLSGAVRRKDPTDKGLAGTLLATVSAEKISGTLTLATGDGATLRTGTFTLDPRRVTECSRRTRYLQWARRFYGRVRFDLATSGAATVPLAALGLPTAAMLDDPSGWERAAGRDRALQRRPGHRGDRRPGDDARALARLRVAHLAGRRGARRVARLRAACRASPRAWALTVRTLRAPRATSGSPSTPTGWRARSRRRTARGRRDQPAQPRRRARERRGPARGRAPWLPSAERPCWSTRCTRRSTRWSTRPASSGAARASSRPTSSPCRSLTKCYGLGPHRFGWVLGPPEVVARADDAITASCGHAPAGARAPRRCAPSRASPTWRDRSRVDARGQARARRATGSPRRARRGAPRRAGSSASCRSRRQGTSRRRIEARRARAARCSWRPGAFFGVPTDSASRGLRPRDVLEEGLERLAGVAADVPRVTGDARPCARGRLERPPCATPLLDLRARHTRARQARTPCRASFHVFGSTFPAFGASLLLGVMVVASYTFAVALAAGADRPPADAAGRALRRLRHGRPHRRRRPLPRLRVRHARLPHPLRRPLLRPLDAARSTCSTALWGGQDGSLLWWLFLLSVYIGACVSGSASGTSSFSRTSSRR